MASGKALNFIKTSIMRAVIVTFQLKATYLLTDLFLIILINVRIIGLIIDISRMSASVKFA